MLANDAALDAVIFEPANAIQALPAGAAHISMSTISVALSRHLAEAHKERKQHYVAAPVFGRPDAAAAAMLFIIAAGHPNRSNDADLFSTLLGRRRSSLPRKLRLPT